MAVSRPTIDQIETEVDQFIMIEKEEGWEFKLEIEEAPPELDLLAKDLEYGPIAITEETKEIGGIQSSQLTGTERVTLTITIRDDKTRKNYNYFKKWAGEMVHADGTFGLPIDYLREVKIYNNSNSEWDQEPEVYLMKPITVGDITKDRSNTTQFNEFPVVLTEHKNSGFKRNRKTVSYQSIQSTITAMK